MPITITITDPTPAQIAALFGLDFVAVESAANGGSPTKRQAAAAKPKAEEPEVKAKPEVQGKDAAGDDVAEVPDQAAVTAAAQKLAGKNGRDALVEMLDKYGAKQVSGVPEDKRQAFIDAVEAALA